jgi:hypothetical protein
MEALPEEYTLTAIGYDQAGYEHIFEISYSFLDSRKMTTSPDGS